jgi:hypothetical protein
MKTKYTAIKGVLMSMGLGMISFAAMSQAHITMSMENITSTSNTIEYDLYLVNDGSTAIKLAAYAYGINYDASILNGGKPGEAANAVVANSRTRSLASLKEYSLKNTNRNTFNQLRMTTTPVRLSNAVELPYNVPYKVGHFKFSNNAPWKANSNPAFALNEYNVPGISTTCATGYVDAATNPIGFSVANKNLSVKIVNSPVLNPSTATPMVGGNQDASNSIAKQDADGQSSINIYPNPTQDIVNINLNSTEVVNTVVKVTDLRGRTLKQIQARSEKGLNTMTISLREVPSGIYNIQVYQNNNLTYTDRITKKD